MSIRKVRRQIGVVFLADKLQVKAIISPLHDKDILDDVEHTPKRRIIMLF